MIEYAVQKETKLEVAKRLIGNVRSRGIINSMLHHSFQQLVPLYKIYRQRFTSNTFSFSGKEYEYFIHKYSCTWSNERAVEIPIFKRILLEALDKDQRILEIGRVFNHYLKNNGRWTVLDKYEFNPDTLNEDIVDYKVAFERDKYDLIISVSTMEHVGFEEDGDLGKVDRAIDNILNNVLSEDGLFIFSVPLGYNPSLDEKIFSGKLSTKHVKYLKRDARMRWHEATSEEVRGSVYGDPWYVSANGLAIVSSRPL